jgi:hypothetical protein
MFKFLKRIFLFISFFLLFFVIKEFIAFYAYLKEVNDIFAYVVLGLIGVAVIYFIVIPIIQILRLPVNPSPVTDAGKEKELIRKRLRSFRKSKLLAEGGTDTQALVDSKKDYDKVVKLLNKESEKIRKKYVVQVFYRTGIIQNGFIDALLILSSAVAMVKEIFILYNGRVSNRDIWKIAKQVYYSMVIGGSESVEYATDEVFSKLATDGMKGIPFLDKIISSVADGFVNAVLITRVALITENYCTMTYVESYRELYPSAKFIVNTAKNLTSGIISNIGQVMKNMTSEKTVDVLLKVGNPVGYIFEKGIDLAFPDKNGDQAILKRNLKSGFSFIGNPIIFGVEKLVHRSRQKQTFKRIDN